MNITWHPKTIRVLWLVVQLKDGNFDEWADAIELALESKNKMGFIDRTIL